MFKEFVELDAWQEARILVNQIYEATKDDPFARDFGLRDQIQRAAVSAMSNIAEGVAANSKAEFRRFLLIARRSTNEVRSLLFVSSDQKYILKEEFGKLQKQVSKVSQIINGLLRYLRNNEITKQQVNE